MGSIKDEDEDDEDDTGDDYSDDEGGSNGVLSRKQRECLVLGLQDIVSGTFPECYYTSYGFSCQTAAWRAAKQEGASLFVPLFIIWYDPQGDSVSTSSMRQDHQAWAKLPGQG